MIGIGSLVRVTGARSVSDDHGNKREYRPELIGREGLVSGPIVGGWWVDFDKNTCGGFLANQLKQL